MDMETLTKIKVLLGMEAEVTPAEMEEANEQLKFEDAQLEDGTTISADAFEAGEAVWISVEEERQPLPVGEYAMADGSLLVVAEEGIIAEIKAAEEAPEEAPEEEEMKADNSKDALIQAIGVLENLVQEFEAIKTEFNALKEKSAENFEKAKEDAAKVEVFESAGEEIKPNPEGNFAATQTLVDFSKLTASQRVQYLINKNK
tara:strand:- start:55 stop:660 length:606 start_codon:yes stop_codon:yes gene_type:complete